METIGAMDRGSPTVLTVEAGHVFGVVGASMASARRSALGLTGYQCAIARRLEAIGGATCG